ncbi:FliI/YscN family ATPase [Colwellia sp. MEBiC06753]
MSHLARVESAIDSISSFKKSGKVIKSVGLVIEAHCPNVFIGELCELTPKFSSKPILAEVVGFKDDKTLLMPYEKVQGLTYGSKVVAKNDVAKVPVGEALLGRVIDAFSQPLDEYGKIHCHEHVPLFKDAINPMQRKNISDQLTTGIKAIDSFTSIGKGQRIGVFSGSGVGKSTLLSQMCQSLDDDINILVLLGERGREVVEFVEDTLGKEKLANSVVIVATAEQSPLTKTHCAHAAIAIAEYFSEQGKNVLLTIDSITRLAIAQRDLGLAIGEPSTLGGYTPSVFTLLPSIVERCGSFKDRGAITAVLTVLVEGGDFDEPVVDALRAILDGHIILSRELAEKGHYPAIDILKSVSRLFTSLNTKEQLTTAREIKKLVASYEENKDLIQFSGDKLSEKNKTLMTSINRINRFLTQESSELVSLEDTRLKLATLAKEVRVHDE